MKSGSKVFGKSVPPPSTMTGKVAGISKPERLASSLMRSIIQGFHGKSRHLTRGRGGRGENSLNHMNKSFLSSSAAPLLRVNFRIPESSQDACSCAAFWEPASGARKSARNSSSTPAEPAAGSSQVGVHWTTPSFVQASMT